MRDAVTLTKSPRDEALERLKPTIEAWKKTHGKVLLLTPSGLVQAARLEDIPFIIRKPTRAEMSRALRDNAKDPLGAIQNLMLDATLSPDRVILAQLFEELPGLAGALQSGMTEMLGIGLDFSATEL